MAANQTIIKAAGQAYAKPKVDIKPMVEGMLAVSKVAVSMVERATKRMGKLNKAFNIVDSLDNKDMTHAFQAIRNDPNLSYSEKLRLAETFKNDHDLLVEWSDKVGKFFDKDNPIISGEMNAKTKMWLSSIVSESYYGPYSLQDINNDGVISDEEVKLQPIRVVNNQLSVINEDGTGYTAVKDLRDDFINKNASDELYDDFHDRLGYNTKKYKDGDNTSLIANYVKEEMVLFDQYITDNPSAAKSFWYDKKVNVNGKNLYPVEHWLQESGWGSADALESVKLVGSAYYTGMDPNDMNQEILALWEVYLAAEGDAVKREAANNLFRSIMEEETGGDLPNDYLLDLLERSGTQNLTRKYATAE